nr:hypothetical protein [Tenuifilaceae bacterium]HOF92502.1 hypothetical protein [Tenuifilaceae bacterium]HOM86340.1 hypothetical protein [Tenuifilaceae bacterium]HOQ36018.1 hypothetical protein [Tenuifilaceae bacterium]HOU64320.1 hypothetical protein [Tenuifilaceae bacterium]
KKLIHALKKLHLLVESKISLKKLFPKTEDFVIYSGEEIQNFQEVKFINWRKIGKIFSEH